MSTSMTSQGNLGNTNPQNGGAIASTAVGTDSLTLSQLAGMSKHQLYQIVSQMKDLIHQNQQQVRQILIANPQLTKTLFQAQIMLGMVRAPDTSPSASVPAQPLQQPQVPEVPPTPPPQSAAVLQPRLHQQQAPQQVPPQMASPYLQQSQASSAAVQSNQPSFVFQQFVQQHQQTSPLTNTVPPHSQPSAASTLQQHGPPPPLLPLHPPLPQQPRPLAPPPQMQHSNTHEGISFAAHPVAQSYQPQSPYLSIHQQQGGSPQTNAGPPFQQMLAPPLPSQPSPQQMFQVSRSGNVNIGSSGILPIGGALDTGRGLSMGISSTSAPLMTWNHAVPSSAPMGAPHVTLGGVTGHVVAGHHHFGGMGLSSPMANPNPPQVFNQAMAQPQPQPPQQLQHQPQMQTPIELEQQKALLQQVMNLTPEQIYSLPPEQRQQVLQLQQAFRSQTG